MPVLLGWASREPVLGGHQGIVTVNGLFRPFALVDGQAAGIWAYCRRPGGARPVRRSWRMTSRTALAAEARDVQRFLAGSSDATAEAVGQDRDEAA